MIQQIFTNLVSATYMDIIFVWWVVRTWALEHEEVILDLNLKMPGHDMAIVGEPCNGNAHAKIPYLFMTMVCPRLCVHMYCMY